MALGIYIHIPYCLQKCHYCDFMTLPLDHEMGMAQYKELLLAELRSRAHRLLPNQIQSIYFGGGTPSLMPASDILALRNELANVGFEIQPNAEISLEINPGTLNDEKLDFYLAAGVNRFSVGVQTFNDSHLKHCGREHSAQDSRETLSFLKERNLNYSFDLLFGLPNQTLQQLNADLTELLSFSPNHVSIYNLTVPPKHPMNRHRAGDLVQVEMFDLIDRRLSEGGIFRYELSNFSRPGFESSHNSLYWSDSAYWGLGISAHSYLPHAGPWGTRFWNPASHRQYISQIQALSRGDEPFYLLLPKNQMELLQQHEALTDYCHTHLRMLRGLCLSDLQEKFSAPVSEVVRQRLEKLVLSGHLDRTQERYRLSSRGLPLANQIFLELTFLPEDIIASPH